MQYVVPACKMCCTMYDCKRSDQGRGGAICTVCDGTGFRQVGEVP